MHQQRPFEDVTKQFAGTMISPSRLVTTPSYSMSERSVTGLIAINQCNFGQTSPCAFHFYSNTSFFVAIVFHSPPPLLLQLLATSRLPRCFPPPAIHRVPQEYMEDVVSWFAHFSNVLLCIAMYSAYGVSRRLVGRPQRSAVEVGRERVRVRSRSCIYAAKMVWTRYASLNYQVLQ